MNTLISWLKKFPLRRVLTVVLAGVLLVVTTACNTGDVRGARPTNPPVQMGGANNPHKGGGDGYTNYKMSEDPKVSPRSGSQSLLPAGFDRLVATSDAQSSASDLLYPGKDAVSTENKNIGPINTRGQGGIMTPQIPAPKQAVIDRSDPDVKILEKVGEAFKDASSFLKDTAESAADKPEMQANPSLHR